MTTKDWILLLVPIFCNGVFFVILQKVFLDKYIRHRLMKESIIKEFLDKLKSLSDLMIQSNFDSRSNSDSISESITEIQKRYVDLVKFTAANTYDLKKFNADFNQLCTQWDLFVCYYNKFMLDKNKTIEQCQVLGKKLQDIFDLLQKLISKVRKKY